MLVLVWSYVTNLIPCALLTSPSTVSVSSATAIVLVLTDQHEVVCTSILLYLFDHYIHKNKDEKCAYSTVDM